MKYRLRSTLVLLFVAGAATPLAAGTEGDPESTRSLFPLDGRHAIWLRAGLLSSITVESNVSAAGVSSEVRDDGPFFSIGYEYWVNPEWSVGFDLSFVDAGASSTVDAGGVTSEAASVTAVLFGASFYPRGLAIGPSLRPCASLAAGPYIGSASNSTAGTTVTSETVSETAVGLRAQIGADVFFGGRFSTGIALGYAFVSDFDQPIGSHTNYSGPEFSLGLGILLGAAR